MKKNPYYRILRGELKEQCLSTILKSHPINKVTFEIIKRGESKEQCLNTIPKFYPINKITFEIIK